MAQTQVQNSAEKEIVQKILTEKRVLFYRAEFSSEIPERYMLYYDDESSADVVTLKEIKEQIPNDIADFLKAQASDVEVSIEILGEMVENYVSMKTDTCLTKGNIWKTILEKSRKYFDVQVDNSEYNVKTYSGKIRYQINLGDNKVTIVEEIFYCNKCLTDAMIDVGIQKCVKYYLQTQK